MIIEESNPSRVSAVSTFNVVTRSIEMAGTNLGRSGREVIVFY
jgi:hypothetical protein